MNMNYSNKIKEYRNHELLTQEELAKKLGVAFVNVNCWEKGHHAGIAKDEMLIPLIIIKRELRKLFRKAGISEEE